MNANVRLALSLGLALVFTGAYVVRAVATVATWNPRRALIGLFWESKSRE